MLQRLKCSGVAETGSISYFIRSCFKYILTGIIGILMGQFSSFPLPIRGVVCLPKVFMTLSFCDSVSKIQYLVYMTHCF